MSVLLPLVLFLSWFAFSLVPAGKLAIEDELNHAPEDKRRGTSIFPGFPVMPLLYWGLAWLIDRLAPTWGTRIFLVLHVLLFIVSATVIARDILHLRRISRPKD